MFAQMRVSRLFRFFPFSLHLFCCSQLLSFQWVTFFFYLVFALFKTYLARSFVRCFFVGFHRCVPTDVYLFSWCIYSPFSNQNIQMCLFLHSCFYISRNIQTSWPKGLVLSFLDQISIDSGEHCSSSVFSISESWFEFENYFEFTSRIVCDSEVSSLHRKPARSSELTPLAHLKSRLPGTCPPTQMIRFRYRLHYR